MFGEDIFAAALGLTSPWFISSINFNVEDRRLDIEIDFKRGSKFDYVNSDGSRIPGHVHDTRVIKWQHLNFFQHKCFLQARIPRVKNDDGAIQRVRAPWEGEINGFTKLFEALLLQLISAMPVLKVQKFS